MSKSLSVAEIEEALKTHKTWKLQGGKLVQEWKFKDFVEAMEFVNRVATLAESAGHHPDIDIRYNQVLLGLVSHDAGGVTNRDISMAAQIDKKFPQK
jgi:4a-hydroxytetrahydrobiopterin dehydratase